MLASTQPTSGSEAGTSSQSIPCTATGFSDAGVSGSMSSVPYGSSIQASVASAIATTVAGTSGRQRGDGRRPSGSSASSRVGTSA